VQEVGFRQTHISLLFFAGDRVYKVKKPVDLGFLDFSTLDRRRHYCEEEVRLNQALAPGVYLGVVPITEEDDGSLRIAGRGRVVEYAVEMRRLPQPQMLDQVLERGEIDNERLRELAALLAEFHRAAATGGGVDEYGTPEAVAFNVRENFEQTRGFVAPPGEAAPAGARTLSPILHAFLSRRAETFLEREHRLLSSRVSNGRIRDGHGDLHAGNICLTDEGIVVYDRIEFAERFRCSDVACDLAFLAMDLDLLQFRAFSSYLVRTYAELAEDEDLELLVPFYKTYRAIVRAKVASIASAASELGPDEREAHRLEAFRHFHLAASYELPPALVLSCGLPASGKSYAARAIAEPFEAPVFRSDVKRKQLAGLPPARLEPVAYGTGLYAPEMSDRTYAALREEAGNALRRGRTAIVDASFSSARQRRPFAELAAELGVPFVVVELRASEATIRERLERRARESGNPSDADLGIYLAMRQDFEPPDELDAGQLARVDATLPEHEIVAVTIDRLISQVDLSVEADAGRS
jgi:aminoglycoside phosphotransferase family enzyme/predicted kinase